MRTFTKIPRGRCASCEGEITSTPVYKMDEAYCCTGCAEGGPCVCLYEADLASDGVDHLGLPFPMTEFEPGESETAPDPLRARA